jgi:4-amino-4-deoxy-L-arabinose transferase-like glycosyltransferase
MKGTPAPPISPSPSASAPPSKEAAPLSKSWEVGLLLAITLLAAFLRFYRLTEIPPGLHYDEAFKGTTARAMLEGAPLQIFFRSNMGEEPAAIYLVMAALRVAGQEPWVVRLPSAILGTLTIPLAWWLGRELAYLARAHRPGLWRWASHPAPGRAEGRLRPEPEGLAEQLAGLGTATVLAILYWHLNFSRLGMEPILVPFFATLAFAALARGLNGGYLGKTRLLAFSLAGLALGGSLYTYKAGYLVPVLAVLFVIYAAIVERGFLRRHGRGLLVACLVALLVALPIGIYFATHPADFLLRPTSVALTYAGQPGGPQDQEALSDSWLADNLLRVLGMFFVQGDENPRSNLPGRPVLDPFLALLFVIGLGRALAGFHRPALALLPIWLGVMIVPTILTEYAPHFPRAIGATPAVALLCSCGGWTLWQGVSRLTQRWLAAALALALAVGLFFSGTLTARDYFHTWAQSPDLFYAHDVGLVEIAQYINTLPSEEEVYLTPTSSEHCTLQYVADRPFASFDGRAGLVLPPPATAATFIIILHEDQATLPALEGARPDGIITLTLTDDYGSPYAAAYHLPSMAEEERLYPPPDYAVEATLGSVVRLQGYSLDREDVAPGDTLSLTLHWQALAPLDEDYTVFTHLLGAHNPATNGPLWAGHDSQPVGGHYATGVWQPGEVILDVHPLTIPTDAPPGQYRLEVGLYLLSTMTRLPATDAVGNPLPDDAVLLGAIEVRN